MIQDWLNAWPAALPLLCIFAVCLRITQVAERRERARQHRPPSGGRASVVDPARVGGPDRARTSSARTPPGDRETSAPAGSASAGAHADR